MRNLILAVVAVIAICSCKSQYELLLNSNDSDAKYEAAFELFNNGKYSKAATMFESLAMLTDGTERDDTVRYYWGLSNYKAKDYYTADANFEAYVNHYPRSPFTSEARYLRLDCLYLQTLRYELDQTPTRKAMMVISEFMYEHPDSEYYPVCKGMMDELMERLERKSFESAKLYYSMEDYQAARHALKNVLKENADNRYREDVLYYTAMASYKYAHNSVEDKQKDRFLNFIDDYYNFISEYPESKYRKELDNLYGKVEHYAVKPSDKSEEQK